MRPVIEDVPASSGGGNGRGRGWATAIELVASSPSSDITPMRRRIPMTNRLICGIALFAGLMLASPAAYGQDVPVVPAVPSRPRAAVTFTKTIGNDLKSMVSAENVTVLSSATALALLAAPFDKTLTYSASCSTFLKTTFDGWARMVGEEWFLAAGAAGTYAFGRVTNRSDVVQVGVDLMEAEIVAGITTHVLKYSTQRTRPDGEEFSFPSGHAAGTFAIATVLQRHYGLKAGLPAYTMATLISTARGFIDSSSRLPM